MRLLHLATGEVREHYAVALRQMIGVARRTLPPTRWRRRCCGSTSRRRETVGLAMDTRVRRAIDLLVARPAEPFALAKLARHCGASVSRLVLLSKRETGGSPQKFLERHRTQRASQLPRPTNLSVGAVAVEMGYAAPFYFSNRFRRFAGKSPSAYRR